MRVDVVIQLDDDVITDSERTLAIRDYAETMRGLVVREHGGVVEYEIKAVTPRLRMPRVPGLRFEDSDESRASDHPILGGISDDTPLCITQGDDGTLTVAPASPDDLLAIPPALRRTKASPGAEG